MSLRNPIPRIQPVDGPRSRRSLIAWFAGVDLDILARAPGERSFYQRLGAGVLLVSCASGLAFSFALGYALRVPAAHLWWAGLAWAALLACGVEPLILQLSPTRRSWALGLGVSWRLLFSIVLAFQLSEPLILTIDRPEINRQLLSERQDAERQAEARTNATFDPGIERALQARREIQRQRSNLTNRIANDELKRAQAAEAGCGPVCHRYATAVQAGAARLDEVEKANRHRLPGLNATLDALRNQRGEHRRQSGGVIGESGGLWARIGALETVAAKSSAMTWEVWGLRVLCLLLDLLPLTAKLYRLATVDSPYERLLAAARRRDALPAKRLEAELAVDEHLNEEQARANGEVRRAEINLDAEQRIAEAGSGMRGGASTPADPPPVSAQRLDDFVARMKPHHRQPVPVPVELMRSGLIGAALIGALAILSTLWVAVTHQVVSGMWLVVFVFVAVAGLAAYTHGFRTAPGWALRAIFATFLVGLLLPPIIVAINV